MKSKYGFSKANKEGLGYQIYLSWFSRKIRGLRIYYMNTNRQFFITTLFILIFFDHAYSQTCSEGKHKVRSHIRKGSKVKAYCRKNPKGYKIWHELIDNKQDKAFIKDREIQKKWKPDEGVYQKGTVILYDTAFKNNQILKATVYHEFSHALWESYVRDKQKKYLKKFN